jgi:hypothetical protein
MAVVDIHCHTFNGDDLPVEADGPTVSRKLTAHPSANS